MREIIGRLIGVTLLIAGPLCAAPKLLVPDGYTVEPASTDGQVSFPMFAAFDDRGRLFVAESSGLDLYAELVAHTRKCRVRVLEDPDEHGRFTKSRVFADHLVFPMGLAWRDGKLYVADPPDLVSYEDHDGAAANRTVVLTGFGHTDNGSLHGVTFGPDGMLYLTMGDPDGYRLRRPDGSFLTGKCGALIRCRPDGSDPQVLARGFENLVEIAFLADGRIIGTNNWYQRPSGGVRDALVHLIEGGQYPLHLDDQGTFHVLTGPPLPPAAVFPAVALSGLAQYEGIDAFLQGQLLSAQHNARKVMRHSIVDAGSTLHAESHDFVSSDDPDFHPSDVLEDADGTILVVDTGGWYVQHCPTGKIRDSHAPGGIYRVRYQFLQHVEDPWGMKIDWKGSTPDQLIALLDDPRPAVRRKAQRHVVALGDSALPALSKAIQDWRHTRLQDESVWALVQVPSPGALPPLREALRSSDSFLASAACRALALRNDTASARRLTECLKHPEATFRLAAAEALAHCGNRSVVAALVAALGDEPDRFLEHALIFAIHQWATTADLENALQDAHPRVRKMALLLLDQPPHNQLTADQVFAGLTATDSDLRQMAQSLLRRHPEWAEQSAGYLSRRLRDPQLSESEQQSLLDTLVAFQSNRQIVALVGQALADGKLDSPRRLKLLGAMARMNHPDPIDPWKAGLARALQDPQTRTQAARTIGILTISDFDADLRRIAESDAPADFRIEALRALAPRHPQLSDASLDLLLEQFRSKAAGPLRLAAAEVLVRSALTSPKLVRTLQAVRRDPLATPDALLPLLQHVSDEASARAVIAYADDAITAGWHPSEDKLTDLLKPLEKYDAPTITRLMASARQTAERQKQKLAEYEPLLKGGDPQAGRAVFFGQTVACSACHRVGPEGGHVGPDLTKVGAVRSGRDILESIVFPSSTFAQGYEPYVVAAADGRVLNGILAENTSEAITLRDAAGIDTRLRRDQIKQLRRDQTSIMPEGLDRALTPKQFRDLLAFLQSLK